MHRGRPGGRLTDRCNLKCAYCIPKGMEWVEKTDILSFAEITRLVRVLASTGVRKVRLTGGGPTVRPGLPDLVRMIRAIPGIASLIVVDSEQTIVYSSDPKTIGMVYRNEADRSFLVSGTPTRRQLQLAGRTVTEVVWPVYAPLGSV